MNEHGKLATLAMEVLDRIVAGEDRGRGYVSLKNPIGIGGDRLDLRA